MKSWAKCLHLLIEDLALISGGRKYARQGIRQVQTGTLMEKGYVSPDVESTLGEVTRVWLRLIGPSLMVPVGYPIPVQGCKCWVSGTKGLLGVIRG